MKLGQQVCQGQDAWKSLSLRRAWIEMQFWQLLRSTVARHARRSPYGERGLKLDTVIETTRWRRVALLTESVD